MILELYYYFQSPSDVRLVATLEVKNPIGLAHGLVVSDDFCNAWQESDTKRSLCECIGLPFDDFKELGDDKVNIYKKLSEHMLKVKAYYR